MWFVTGVGVSVGYHRYFTHRSFKTSPFFATLLALAGMMAAPGPLLSWVATHRRHHTHSDLDGDPHSPNLFGASNASRLKGLLHSQYGWMRGHDFANPFFYCRDLLRVPRWLALDRYYLHVVVAGLLVPVFACWVLGAWRFTLDAFVWAGLVRLFVVQSIISSVNSICHAHGHRSFCTPEKSANNWIVALLAMGEGWHNNHHAFQTSAFLGLHWWELDLGGLLIRVLSSLGIVWDVRQPAPHLLQAKRASIHSQLRKSST
jgi:stearoyl-CoA desaturase (delta-9 desaturase)